MKEELFLNQNQSRGSYKVDSKENVKIHTKLANFRIEERMWNKFSQKYVNASQRLRELIEQDTNQNDSKYVLNRTNWEELKQLIEKNPALQVVGDVGIGKSTLIKKLIENDKDHIYIVFDAHSEYKLRSLDTISDKIKISSKIKLPEQVEGAKGVFPLYVNQILSKRWKDNYVFVVEEALRYSIIEGLLSESRKFAKIISISQRKIVDFVPSVRIVSKEGVSLNVKSQNKM